MSKLEELFDQVSEVEKDIIRKEAEIDSVLERLIDLDDKDGDDAHRAKTKLRHERERLVELKCKHTDIEVELRKRGFYSVGRSAWEK